MHFSDFGKYLFIDSHRFVYQGTAPHPAEGAAEGPKKAAEKKEAPPSNPDDQDRVTREESHRIIAEAERNMNKLLAGMPASPDKEEQAEFVEDRISDAKFAVEHYANKGELTEEFVDKLKVAMEQVTAKFELKIQVSKLTSGPKSKEMNEIYDRIKDSFYGTSQEHLLIAIDKIFKENKDNPDRALSLVQGEIMKERFMMHCSEKPAESNKLASNSNRLGREQMQQVLQLLNISFDPINISTNQLSQINIVRNIQFHYDGATYMELGLLDDKGNVQKKGLDALLAHEKGSERIDGPDQIERLGRLLGRQAGLYVALQDALKDKGGKPGKLPTITLLGRPFDLNEITAKSDAELNRLDVELKKLDKPDEKSGIPSTVQALLNFRFDESTGADRRVSDKLPPEVKTRLEALGMMEPDVLIDRGRILQIRFKYKGERISLTMGKFAWGDNHEPYLHVYDKYRKISSRRVMNMANLTGEINDIQQYKTDNEDNIKRIDDEKVFDNIYSGDSVLSAKETYLGSLVEPTASNRKGSDPDTVKALEKILPIILANADALGINEETTLMEAMLKIYAKPELLKGNYDSTLAALKNKNSHHYKGVEPEFQYDFPDKKDDIKTSRTSKKPEYLEAKERMKKMKPGEQLIVKFGDKDYTFTLESKFANFDYRFKIEGFENEPPFKIDNVDLAKRSPEKQLQYMMGTTWRRASMDSERMLQGAIKPEDAPKQISIDQDFSKDKLLTHPYFKNLPLNNEQRQLLENLNKEGGIKLAMHTDKYGQIAYCEVQWQDAEKTDYRLRSSSGNYWRLNTLANKSSRTRYPFYDIETPRVGTKLEELKKT